MKLANFVTLAKNVIHGRPATTAGETSSKTVLRRNGKRLIIPSGQVESIYKSQRQKHVRIDYTGPAKIPCLGCGTPFMFTADGKGRYPEYHSNACKQKAYRQRKKSGILERSWQISDDLLQFCRAKHQRENSTSHNWFTRRLCENHRSDTVRLCREKMGETTGRSKSAVTAREPTIGPVYWTSSR